MRKMIVFLLSIMLIVPGTLLSFAAGMVTANIKVGEHGQVNEKTGEFTETPERGTDYVLKVVADEGYVIDKIIVNEEEDSDEMELQMNKSEFETAVTAIDDDISIEFTFKERTSDNTGDADGNSNNTDSSGENTDITDDNTDSDTSENDTGNSTDEQSGGNQDDNQSDNQGSNQGNTKFAVKVTSEGPGQVFTVYENNEGEYTLDASEEDRTISWAADTDQGASVKSVTINNWEDAERAGRLADSYIMQGEDVTMHVVFAVTGSQETIYTVTTEAGEGGTITDPFTYSSGEQRVSWEPDEHYSVESVTVNGEAYENKEGPYVFTEGNQEVSVTFIRADDGQNDNNEDNQRDVSEDNQSNNDEGGQSDDSQKEDGQQTDNQQDEPGSDDSVDDNGLTDEEVIGITDTTDLNIDEGPEIEEFSETAEDAPKEEAYNEETSKEDATEKTERETVAREELTKEDGDKEDVESIKATEDEVKQNEVRDEVKGVNTETKVQTGDKAYGILYISTFLCAMLLAGIITLKRAVS